MDEDHVKNEHVEEQETKTKSHKYILFIKIWFANSEIRFYIKSQKGH